MRRVFASALAALTSMAAGTLSLSTLDRVAIDPRAAAGEKRSTLRRRRKSKYMPHQGDRECARRRRQMAKAF